MRIKKLKWFSKIFKSFWRYICIIYEELDDFYTKNFCAIFTSILFLNFWFAWKGIPPLLPPLWWEQVVCMVILPLCLLLPVDHPNINMELIVAGIIIFGALPITCFVAWLLIEGIELLKKPYGFLLIDWKMGILAILWNSFMFTTYRLFCEILMM